MLTFKNSCTERTKEFFSQRVLRKGGGCGDKWFGWQAVSFMAVAQVGDTEIQTAVKLKQFLQLIQLLCLNLMFMAYM